MAADEFKVSGEVLLKKVKELLREGNIRKIIIKNEKGEPFLEIPVTVGILGAIAAPAFVAIGAVAALANKFTLEVKRNPEPKAKKKK
ncbi:DUF4342 domain-containing protein [Patescibacteria group bacterium]|nr:DUF4342 domain-containing protein [Patescibacteria group bacterium]